MRHRANAGRLRPRLRWASAPKWRNWQTRRSQTPLGATSSGFKSRLRHHDWQHIGSLTFWDGGAQLKQRHDAALARRQRERTRSTTPGLLDTLGDIEVLRGRQPRHIPSAPALPGEASVPGLRMLCKGGTKLLLESEPALHGPRAWVDYRTSRGVTLGLTGNGRLAKATHFSWVPGSGRGDPPARRSRCSRGRRSTPDERSRPRTWQRCRWDRRGLPGRTQDRPSTPARGAAGPRGPSRWRRRSPRVSGQDGDLDVPGRVVLQGRGSEPGPPPRSRFASPLQWGGGRLPDLICPGSACSVRRDSETSGARGR
jgi:hypothetical protein